MSAWFLDSELSTCFSKHVYIKYCQYIKMVIMAASKEVRSTQLASKMIFKEKAVTKSESRQIHHHPRKFT